MKDESGNSVNKDLKWRGKGQLRPDSGCNIAGEENDFRELKEVE